MKRVSIVICYQEGTAPILDACLGSISRHTQYNDFDVLVVARNFDTEGSDVVLGYDFANMVQIKIDDAELSNIHGVMLDHVWPGLNSEMILTLDSDCFPVADGWLQGLVDMIDDGVDVAGILHPWAPPPGDMKKTKIEWRVRSQHCWNVTHVACQLVRKSFLESTGVYYNEGDDTGLAIPMKALELGGRVEGYKVSRCPKPAVTSNDEGDEYGPLIDPEFNRYVCLVFGDKIYHQGGYTRKNACGDECELEESFGWAMKRVVADVSADFLLEDRLSYKFKFDKEDEVAAEKMQRLFGLKQDRMGG